MNWYKKIILAQVNEGILKSRNVPDQNISSHMHTISALGPKEKGKYIAILFRNPTALPEQILSTIESKQKEYVPSEYAQDLIHFFSNNNARRRCCVLSC